MAKNDNKTVLELAKSILEHVQKDPASVATLQKAGLTQSAVADMSSTARMHGAGQEQKSAKDRSSLVKEDLCKDWKPRFYKGCDASMQKGDVLDFKTGKKMGPKDQGSVQPSPKAPEGSDKDYVKVPRKHLEAAFEHHASDEIEHYHDNGKPENHVGSHWLHIERALGHHKKAEIGPSMWKPKKPKKAAVGFVSAPISAAPMQPAAAPQAPAATAKNEDVSDIFAKEEWTPKFYKPSTDKSKAKPKMPQSYYNPGKKPLNPSDIKGSGWHGRA